MENQFLSILALVALVLLVAVTGGVGYLTLVGWRDRQLRDKENRELRLSGKKTKVTPTRKI
ncbi:MAG: hypothetical protein KME60_26435 [Cyanomargarita calcarea GSE-NOS-MK-12-04C]|uniref:Uncharacterized protein n=1 Tax=Cyanomargarita calcarea GSE-NOS-MK-12-04C TaxID=2839659 RepID=A0A951QQX9_9CYAN|nr:hypothetical protein [Cyanomargarita calcarea GSE-NOS-MK-12-04C]